MTRIVRTARRLLRSQPVGAVRLVGHHVVWRRSHEDYAIWPGRNVYSAAPPACSYSLSHAIEALTRQEAPS